MPQQSFLPQDFDSSINEAMAQWGIPGLALSIVKDDEIVLAKGYGVREIGQETPVDEHTVFGVGSVSKPFTATALAALVSDGKLEWDDRVTKYMPDFQHPDPWVTRELTIRDMMSHRTGLPRGVHILLRGLYDLDIYLHRVRYLKPIASFRSKFHYTNTTIEAIGKMFPAIADMSWEDFMQRRIFDPLGMTASSTNVDALQNVKNLSMPHANIDGKVQPIPRCNIGDDASGSINSNVIDVTQWIRLLLEKGTHQGKQLISPAAVNEMHTPQVLIHPEEPDAALMRALGLDSNFATYGLGWVVIDYRGKKMAFHPGGIDGYTAIAAVLPQENLGLVILTNMHENVTMPFLYALMFVIADAYLGKPQRDWNTEILHTVQQMGKESVAAWQKVVEARAEGTSPSLPLEKYAGAYVDNFCGEAKVTQEEGKLVVHYGPTSKADLEHWHYDTFRAIWRNPMFAPEFVTFTFNKMGAVETMNVESMAEFKRTP
ncbi:MAG: serine hydrolase [Candidatus Hodarchaeales archaeon]